VLAKAFYVIYQMPRRVVFEVCVRSASTASTLLEQHNSVNFGIEKPSILRYETGSWSTV
jgi:hypothetical protein